MKTQIECIEEDILIFKKDIENLLINFTAVQPSVNESGGMTYISTQGDRFFYKLESKEKEILQQKLYKDFNRFVELWDYFVEKLPPNNVMEYKRNKDEIENYILQNYATWAKNSKDALSLCEKNLSDILDILRNAQLEGSDKVIFVLDTSAILTNPNIEDWEFAGVNSFRLVIPNTLIDELDSFEMSNKNDSVKKKAQSFINKYKDYAKRGRLSDGVNIVTDKITLQSMPFEVELPKMFAPTNANNNDNKIFCAFLETIRLNINSAVILVAKDAGLHAKANHYGLQVIDPPTV